MDTEILKKQLNEAIEEIQSLTVKTEDIYGAIYGQLPRLEQEIDLTLGETAILLEYFIPHSSATATKEDLQKDDMLKLSQVLRKVEEDFARNSQELVDEQEMLESVNHFLGDEEGEKAGIVALLEMMSQVKERLTEIEIVSLNAIIHAAHLGDAGKAFGVISDNINILSNEAGEHYDQLQEFAENIKQWNVQFGDGLQEMLKCHNELASRQRESLKKLIDLTFESLARVNSLLQDLMDHVKNVVQPVQDIMVSIQAQDIIRQSLENLNKCLGTLIDSINSHQPDEAADSIANLELLNFVAGALELTQKLTANVDAELASSLGEMEEQLTGISLRLRELEEEGSLLAGFLGGRAGDESEDNLEDDLIKTIFSQVQGFMHDFALGLTELQDKIDGFSGTNNLFNSHITGLEKKIQVIRNRIGFLEKLGVLTRIELARMGQQGDSFAREISKITERVVKDVSLNEELIVSLKKKLQEELLQFEKMLGKNREKAVSMLEIAAGARENLEHIEALISRAVQSLGQSCGNLMKVVEDARAHLEEGRELPAKLQEVNACLHNLGSDVALFQQRCLDEAGLEKWEGTSRELEVMLGSLTTYLERVSAHEVMDDVELDVGSEAGDLTLF